MYGKKRSLIPKYSQYFKEEACCQIINIYPNKPDILYILNFYVTPEILDIKALESEIGVSEEGVRLTGTKLIIRIRLKEKLTYASDCPNHSVHGMDCEQYTALSIILPNELDGNNVIDLINCNRLKITPYIESNYTRLFSKREIFSCNLIFLDVKFCI